MLVVDDLLADIHGRTVALERSLDRLHGAVDARAVSAGRSEQQFFREVGHQADSVEAARSLIAQDGDGEHDENRPPGDRARLDLKGAR